MYKLLNLVSSLNVGKKEKTRIKTSKSNKAQLLIKTKTSRPSLQKKFHRPLLNRSREKSHLHLSNNEERTDNHTFGAIE